jgi:SAM-dependent methyltransferase
LIVLGTFDIIVNTMDKIDYEIYWDNYSTHSEHPSVRLRYRFIINQLKKIHFNSLLDIGCGDGYLINLIKNNFPGKKLYGTDISIKAIKLNSSRYKDIQFFPLDISSKKIDENNKYDVVICSEVIEHLENWEQALKNLSNLINENGYLILTTQSGKRYLSDINNGHLQHYGLSNLEIELSKVNLNPFTSYKKGWPFYEMQKWVYEKNENTAKNFHTGEKGNSLFGKFLFKFTYFLFLLSPSSKKLGPQIFIAARKESNHND